jgi:predicted ATPase with chaperone activity
MPSVRLRSGWLAVTTCFLSQEPAKTMLAKRIPTILPSMSFEQGMEITRIRSVTGLLRRKQD